MLHTRSLLLGTLLGFSGAIVGVGFWGCQKDKDNDKATADNKAPNKRAPLPSAPTQTKRELQTVLAQVDDVKITVGDFQSRINRMSPYVRARYTSLETKRDFLQKLIQFEVLAKEAKRRGFDKDPAVVNTLKQHMIQKLTKDEFARKIKPSDIPETELKAFYTANQHMYKKEAQVRVSAIILNKFSTAAYVAKLAMGPAGRSNKGFRDLVGKYSIDPSTKLRGGDLRYFKRTSNKHPRALVEAAFKLKKTGEVTGPITGGNGKYYVIRQTGQRRAVSKTFEQVKRQIKNRLYRKKRRDAQKEFLKKLKAKAKIRVFESNLAKVRIKTGQRYRRRHHHGFPPNPGPKTPTTPNSQ